MDGSPSDDEEFLPLPHYPYDSRPITVPIEIEEAATALYLTRGVIEDAAERLKVTPYKLAGVIDRSPRLIRLHRRLVALLNDKVHKEVVRAFDAEEDRRREWASARVIASDQFHSHPLAPRQPDAPSLTITPTRVIISWDDAPQPAQQLAPPDE
jgi:hypothetical protein